MKNSIAPHTERVRPVACPSASASRQIIQQQSDLTGYDVFFSYVFLEIFGTFRTTETGGRLGCNHRMSLECLAIRWHKS